MGQSWLPQEVDVIQVHQVFCPPASIYPCLKRSPYEDITEIQGYTQRQPPQQQSLWNPTPKCLQWGNPFESPPKWAVNPRGTSGSSAWRPGGEYHSRSPGVQRRRQRVTSPQKRWIAPTRLFISPRMMVIEHIEPMSSGDFTHRNREWLPSRGKTTGKRNHLLLGWVENFNDGCRVLPVDLGPFPTMFQTTQVRLRSGLELRGGGKNSIDI